MNLEVAREETVQVLCRQYAQDHLTTAELETRLEAVYKAQSLPELYALTAGLAPVAAGTAEARLYAPAAPGAAIRAERRIAALFTEQQHHGDWELARKTTVVAAFSQVTLDLREARIPPGVTHLEIRATFAEVKVIVPPGIRTECDGFGLLGTFTAKKSGFAVDDTEAPVLRVTGHAILAEVNVRTRLPDETALAAIRREWRL